jgi:GNAT superfamily N-acetyltransferase
VAGALTFRPIRPGDEPFLLEVYASTRAEELAQVDWTPAQKEDFLRMQFDAQHRHYQAHYPGAMFAIVLQGESPIGRLYLYRGLREFRVIDIALLPAHRGAGVGTRILTEILHEAAQAGKPVSIHVERFNRARALYQRLGFETIEEGPVYLLMRKTY